MSKIKTIMDKLESILSTIRTTNGYPVDVQLVQQHLVAPEHLTDKQDSAAIMLWYAGSSVGREESVWTHTADIIVQVVGFNISFAAFTDIISSIVVALEKNRTLDGEAKDTFLTGITVPEQADPNPDRVREATLAYNVVYLVEPFNLPGV
jgi:hypothetical protein